jgi:hypothetical protein
MDRNTGLAAAALAALAMAGCSTSPKVVDGMNKGRSGPADKPAPVEEKPGECWGVNACKGQGACGGVGHECAGNNACKGKGWLTLTKPKCDAKGGKFKPG